MGIPSLSLRMEGAADVAAKDGDCMGARSPRFPSVVSREKRKAGRGKSPWRLGKRRQAAPGVAEAPGFPLSLREKKEKLGEARAPGVSLCFGDRV